MLQDVFMSIRQEISNPLESPLWLSACFRHEILSNVRLGDPENPVSPVGKLRKHFESILSRGDLYEL
jgi:hypothetical protein